MRLVMTIAALSALCSTAANASPPTANDRAALERLASENDAAWTAKDWATITNQYAAGGTLRVDPTKAVELGQEAIGRFFQASFSRRPDGFRHITKVENIEMVTPNLAIADAHVRVERLKDADWVLAREFVSSSLAIREGGNWKLHSVRANPLPAR